MASLPKAPKRHRCEAIGDPLVIARFWAKVDRRGDCWLWTGSTDGRGYGHMKVGAQTPHAHRISWLIAFGDIPVGLLVLHRCDRRACVRPEHLFLGTALQNSLDMMAKERWKGGGPGGQRHARARLTDEQAREIRVRFAAGATRAALAQSFGVGRHVVEQIVKGQSYVAAGGPTQPAERAFARYNHGKVTAETVREIRARRAAGERAAALAAEFGLHLSSIGAIAGCSTWRHVAPEDA